MDNEYTALLYYNSGVWDPRQSTNTSSALTRYSVLGQMEQGMYSEQMTLPSGSSWSGENRMWELCFMFFAALVIVSHLPSIQDGAQ